MKHMILTTLIVVSFVFTFEAAKAADSSVPEPFQGFDPTSTKTINYDVLSQLLNDLVVDIGQSDRRTARIVPDLGTRIIPNVTKRSLYEGNRFFFESFTKNEKARDVLTAVRNSLEQIPSQAALEGFSRDEQLAYWLNLYNITILNEIVTIYPTRDLQEFLLGEHSVLSKKLLSVAGISLSLNDIQFTILKENYDNNPMVIYGLYQGNIGSPSIRKSAFTGENVHRALESNAVEFINSNRGTSRDNLRSSESKVLKVLEVSSFYARNEVFFPDFNNDLTAHLFKYIDGIERSQVSANTELKPVINDWTVTDLWGTFPVIANGIANNTGVLDGITQLFNPPNGDGLQDTSAGMVNLKRLPPQVYKYLLAINTKRIEENKRKGTVTMEELGEVSADSDVDQKIMDG